jgi:hypothetical protein
MSRTAKRRKVAITLAGPDFRAQHLHLRKVRELDPDGEEVTHHRTVDTLGLMLQAGNISQAMHDAAREFHKTFTFACLDRLGTIDLERSVRDAGTGMLHADLTDAQVGARERVARALDALGGHGSPAASCVWYVVGLECSIREWALRQGWGGRPVRQESAQGILVAALGVLAKHYGHRD